MENLHTHVCLHNAYLLVMQAYDQHLNMILGDVEETVTTVVIDDETYEEIYKVVLVPYIKVLSRVNIYDKSSVHCVSEKDKTPNSCP